jgi:hypothetical protein
MNSSRKQTGSTLASFSPAKLQGFLAEIANLNDSSQAANRLAKRFAEFDLYSAAFRASAPSPENREEEEKAVLHQLQKFFQAVWLEKDNRRREWNGAVFRVYLARPPLEHTIGRIHQDPMALILPEPLPESPLEKALDYLLRSHYKARYCENPSCPAPYFFGAKSTQRYCGESCAEHGQREAKRRWWEEHGAQWRSDQKKKSPRKKISTKKRR